MTKSQACRWSRLAGIAIVAIVALWAAEPSYAQSDCYWCYERSMRTLEDGELVDWTDARCCVTDWECANLAGDWWPTVFGDAESCEIDIVGPASYQCSRDYQRCSSLGDPGGGGGGGVGGGGGGACNISPGHHCPAECFSCNVSWY